MANGLIVDGDYRPQSQPTKASGGGMSSVNWGNVASNVGAGIGSYLGGQQQAQGYKNAASRLEAMGRDGDLIRNHQYESAYRINANQAASATKTQQMMDPYSKYTTGYAAQLNQLMTDPNSVRKDPGYQFAFNEGQQAIERAAGARGLGNSGNVMAALQQRGQDIASQQYGSIIDRLTKLVDSGAQRTLAAGQQYGNMITQGNQIESNMINQGNTINANMRTGAATGAASAAVGQGMSEAGGTAGMGAAAGTAIGAVAGSFFPVVGTAVGGMLGGVVGSLFD